MHRNKLLDLLEKYIPFDADELQMRSKTIEFVKNNPDCFERELLVGHVTGSAWITDKSRAFVLLIHHRKLNRWLQPGGHCDGDANVLNVAMKEANEETGLLDIQALSPEIFDVDVHEIPARKDIPAHLHYDVRFLLEADKNEQLLISDESNDLAWVELSKLSEYNNSESIMRMGRKILNYQSQ